MLFLLFFENLDASGFFWGVRLRRSLERQEKELVCGERKKIAKFLAERTNSSINRISIIKKPFDTYIISFHILISTAFSSDIVD